MTDYDPRLAAAADRASHVLDDGILSDGEAARIGWQSSLRSSIYGEFSGVIASRILYSRFYTILYATMLFFSILDAIVMLVYVSSNEAVSSKVVLCLVFFVNIVVFAEISFRIVAMRGKFFQSWSNKFDFIVLVICGVAFIVFCVDFNNGSITANMGDNVAEVFNSLLLFFRSGYMVFRLMWLIKGHGKHFDDTGAGGSSYIDFNSLEEDIPFDFGDSGTDLRNSSSAADMYATL